MLVLRAGGRVSAWTLVAAGVTAAAAGAAVVDYVVAAELLGPAPVCRAGSCGDYPGWREESERRANEVAGRTWAYTAVAAAAVAGATTRALRRRPPAERRTIFANLGSVGVLLGALYALLLWLTQHSRIEVDMRPGWFVVGSMLAGAALGGTLTRLRMRDADVRFFAPGWRRYFDYAAIAAAGTTVVTLILVAIFTEQQSKYSCNDPVPASEYDYNEYVSWAAAGTALGAAVLALAGLLARHWFNATICLLANAALLLFMVVSQLC